MSLQSTNNNRIVIDTYHMVHKVAFLFPDRHLASRRRQATEAVTAAYPSCPPTNLHALTYRTPSVQYARLRLGHNDSGRDYQAGDIVDFLSCSSCQFSHTFVLACSNVMSIVAWDRCRHLRTQWRELSKAPPLGRSAQATTRRDLVVDLSIDVIRFLSFLGPWTR